MTSKLTVQVETNNAGVASTILARPKPIRTVTTCILMVVVVLLSEGLGAEIDERPQMGRV